MKKIVLLAAVFCSIVSLAYAADLNTKTLKGTIIDNLCANSQKPADLPDFIKTHPKSCAIKPSCAAGGYSIYTDGKLLKFDEASNAKIETFLKRADSKLEVRVVVRKTGEALHLIAIEDQN